MPKIEIELEDIERMKAEINLVRSAHDALAKELAKVDVDKLHRRCEEFARSLAHRYLNETFRLLGFDNHVEGLNVFGELHDAIRNNFDARKVTLTLSANITNQFRFGFIRLLQLPPEMQDKEAGLLTVPENEV